MNFSWLDFSNPVAIWWIFLASASCLNIIFWLWTLAYWKGQKNAGPQTQRAIWLSAGYVFGCAFRSFFPRADVQRICLWDTWFSSVFIGRTVATIAELCFIMQWALVIRFLAESSQAKLAQKISGIIVPLIAIAECFSWFAVITTNYFGNSVEESLWAISYTLIGIALIDLWPKFRASLKLAMQFSLLGCVLYVGFMSLVDVPMYIHRLLADTAAGKEYFGLVSGIIDLNTRWIVTHSIADWRTEIPWMSLYFSFAVLVSLALCYVPLSLERLKKYLK